MYKNLDEIKIVIESLERVYDIILTRLDPTKQESFEINLSHLTGIQERIEELLFEAEIIKLLNQSNISI